MTAPVAIAVKRKLSPHHHPPDGSVKVVMFRGDLGNEAALEKCRRRVHAFPSMKSVRALYEGRVQGVGFRWTVKDLSREFDVAGTVKNLPDGRVEVVAQGDETDGFLEEIRRSALAGHIEQERLETIPRVQGLRGFLIIP